MILCVNEEHPDQGIETRTTPGPATATPCVNEEHPDQGIETVDFTAESLVVMTCERRTSRSGD